ncbi:MAG TPA: glycine oxidase ThiO [Dermatophilaceae bacterium]|nr:glycine oxidase ThiO [Dermatophilaceae bacterium]
MSADQPSVCVVGAGVIGLSVAWRLAESGCRVRLFDPAPGNGATYAAAGMLAPVSESAFGETEVLELGVESLRRWPEFAADLERQTDQTVGLRRRGTLLAAHDADDARELRRFAAFVARHGFPADPLTGRSARALEPALSPRTSAALAVHGDHSVDNRALTRALLSATARAGVVLHAGRAVPVLRDGTVAGVDVPDTGDRHRCDVVVIAAGADSSTVAGLPAGTVPHVRPVKGQILRFRGAAGLLQRTVRARVAGDQVYLVPRDHGELVVGATTEDVGRDARVTAGGVHDLLRAATTVVPEVRELELTEACARLRPSAADNLPLIGASSVPGLVLATAHYRGGVLMAPATAAAVADLVHGRACTPAAAACAPTRFAARATRRAPVHPSRVTREATA